MPRFATLADSKAIEAEMPWEERDVPRTLYQMLSDTAQQNGGRNAVSFQLLSDPKAPAETLTWSELHEEVTQAANLFRSLGVGESDVVALLLPNATEMAVALLGGAVAGIVNPINPLLEPDQIAAILRETGAKVLVTLKPFPKADVAQKAAEALTLAPNVETVLEVDLARYLSAAEELARAAPAAQAARPRTRPKCSTSAPSASASGRRWTLPTAGVDRVAAYFHTGGTTGMPKVAQHRYSGMIYNGWIGNTLLFTESDNVICPLPMFHVFATHVILMAMLASGAHVVFPTPPGYRGDGVFDNFWKLVERWQVTFIIAVPTAIAR